VALQPGAFTQEMWGVVNGNYAGINSTLINPTGILHSKLYLDVNVVTADLFFENNAFYIHRSDYRPVAFLRSGDNLPEYGKDALPFDYYRNSMRKDLHVSAFVMGPSFSVSRRDDAFGFHTAFRSVISARNVPYEIIPFSYEGLNYDPLHNINFNDDDMLVTGMSWMEAAFSYARTIYKRGPDHLSAGITAKALFGMAGAYLDIENIDYIVNNDSTLNIRNIRGELGFSETAFPGEQLFSGRGFAFDVGFSYVKKRSGYSGRLSGNLCKQPYEEYRYRIGVSLLDLGMMRFGERSQRHAYDDVGTFWENVDTVNFRNLDQFVRMVSNELYGDPGASLRGNRLRMMLPAAFSLQYDHHFQENLYLNGTLIVPLMSGTTAIHRPAQIAVTPRYETQYLEFSVPVSLYDFRYPRVGLAARFWFFTIGTDKLLGFFNLTDFTGLDLYVSLKFNFLKGKCRNRPWDCGYQRSWKK
jgi:hypothetical protein